MIGMVDQHEFMLTVRALNKRIDQLDDLIREQRSEISELKSHIQPISAQGHMLTSHECSGA